MPGYFEGETVTRRALFTGGALAAGGIATAAIALPAIGFALGPVFDEVGLRLAETWGRRPTSAPTTTRRSRSRSIRPCRRGGQDDRLRAQAQHAIDGERLPGRVHRDLDALRPPRLPRALGRARRSGSCVRATAASTTRCGEVEGGPPVRPLDRFQTRVQNGQVQLGPRFSVNSELKRFSARDPGEPLGRPVAVPVPEALLGAERPVIDGDPDPQAPAARPAQAAASAGAHERRGHGQGPGCRGRGRDRRLGRRAHRRRRIHEGHAVPQGPEGDQLVLHARLGDAVRVPVAGGDRRGPRDVLRPGPVRAPTTACSTSPTTCGSAASCAACTAGARR